MPSVPMLEILWPLAVTVALGVAAEKLARAPRSGADALRLVHGATLYVIGTILIGVAVPAAQWAAALAAKAGGYGLLQALDAPLWLAAPVALLALDFGEWLSHRLLHAVPLLWRAHRLHHDDDRMDAATALRFHPFEVLIRQVVTVAAVSLVGAPPVAVAAAAIVTVAMNVWQHAAAAFPAWTERLGAVLVTPTLHHVHHSADPADHNTNFGVIFSFWDRLAGTLRPPQTAAPRFGLGVASTPSRTLMAMLIDPLRPDTPRY